MQEKYDTEYIKERMDDFLLFRRKLRDQGYKHSETGEILLYMQFRRQR